ACGGGATLRHREGDRGDTPARGAAELRSRHARARPASIGGARADGAPAPPPPAAGRRGVVASGTIAGPTGKPVRDRIRLTPDRRIGVGGARCWALRTALRPSESHRCGTGSREDE